MSRVLGHTSNSPLLIEVGVDGTKLGRCAPIVAAQSLLRWVRFKKDCRLGYNEEMIKMNYEIFDILKATPIKAEYRGAIYDHWIDLLRGQRRWYIVSFASIFLNIALLIEVFL